MLIKMLLLKCIIAYLFYCVGIYLISWDYLIDHYIYERFFDKDFPKYRKFNSQQRLFLGFILMLHVAPFIAVFIFEIFLFMIYKKAPEFPEFPDYF